MPRRQLTFTPTDTVDPNLMQYVGDPAVVDKMTTARNTTVKSSEDSTIDVNAKWATSKVVKKYLKKGKRIPTGRIKKGKKCKRQDTRDFKSVLKSYFATVGISTKKKWAKRIIRSTTTHFIDKIYK
jgi:hypothetical protein